jgi:hypothetical protein
MEVKLVLIRVFTSIGLLHLYEDSYNGYDTRILLVLVMSSLAAAVL